jgi:hypothetical protein
MCGRLKVPLDYTNPSDTRTAQLAVVKFTRTKKGKKGTLFFNPGQLLSRCHNSLCLVTLTRALGGPGGSGVESMFSGIEGIISNTDGYYDIVSWGPRGVGSRTMYVVQSFYYLIKSCVTHKRFTCVIFADQDLLCASRI